MYDLGKVTVGLVIFFLVFTFPLYYNMGKATPPPEPNIQTEAIAAMSEPVCVENTEYMRANHMKLLNEWRTSVVRNSNRAYPAFTGVRYEMSLSNTCMECHSNKEKFCDSCHNYAGVSPYCWECHLQPKEMK
ncbi:MAG: sulfate reduction electron transfer complex DsrMKJOP subunit DsrJ [Proteobacteria bacterium]|nr:sulfate reduction electron transfer complex DsrMKJOP subunit DsrJ [Pseudomonadota bacterium]